MYRYVTPIASGFEDEDGRRLVMLNSKGSGDNTPDSLAAFLRLVAGQEVSGDPFVDRINAMIDELVVDPRWMEEYMTFEDELEAARREAERVGMQKGEAIGLERGARREAL